MSDDVRYELEYWRGALEAADLYGWDSIDAGERHGPLAQWLCDQAIDHDNVQRDDQRIEAAFNALESKGETEFSPERLTDILWSFNGETVDDWRTLAEEYAEENGYKLVGLETTEQYQRWYAENGIREGEVYASTSVGGTLYWFDTNKW